MDADTLFGAVHDKFKDWGLAIIIDSLDCEVCTLIYQYLGVDRNSHVDEAGIEKLRLLNGEHGWSIYQAWKARQCTA